MSVATLGTSQAESVEPSESLIAELHDALQAIPPAERPAPDRRADYTAREVADLAGLSMATIRREVRLGRLVAVRDGQRFAIPVVSYIRWRAARRRPVGGAQR